MVINIIKKYASFIKYIIVNCVTTFIYWVGYYFMVTYFKMDYMIANLISYIAALVLAYVLTNNVVFDAKTNSLKKVMAFVLTRIIFIGVNSAMVWILVETKLTNEYIAPVFATCICFLLSYYINKKIFTIDK